MNSIVARSGPTIFTPTAVRMPVACISTRALIGAVQVLQAGQLHTLVEVRQQGLPCQAGRHSLCGLSRMIVSSIDSGAGSVAVSLAPPCQRLRHLRRRAQRAVRLLQQRRAASAEIPAASPACRASHLHPSPA